MSIEINRRDNNIPDYFDSLVSLGKIVLLRRPDQSIEGVAVQVDVGD